MFRLWGKEFKDNRMLRDTVICDDTEDTRTHKIFNALDAICYEFDLSKPIWLISTIEEFKNMIRQDLRRIILWIPLILITWKSMLLRSKGEFPLTPSPYRFQRGLLSQPHCHANIPAPGSSPSGH